MMERGKRTCRSCLASCPWALSSGNCPSHPIWESSLPSSTRTKLMSAINWRNLQCGIYSLSFRGIFFATFTITDTQENDNTNIEISPTLHCFRETLNVNLLLMMPSFFELFTMAMCMRLSILPSPMRCSKATASSLPLMELFGHYFLALRMTNCAPFLICMVKSSLPNTQHSIIRPLCRHWDFLVLFVSKSPPGGPIGLIILVITDPAKLEGCFISTTSILTPTDISAKLGGNFRFTKHNMISITHFEPLRVQAGDFVHVCEQPSGKLVKTSFPSLRLEYLFERTAHCCASILQPVPDEDDHDPIIGFR